MSRYGLLYPEYWDGPTGRRIQTAGGKNATLLGAYLTSNRRATMLGLYRLPLADVMTDTPLSLADLVDAFAVLEDLQFAEYDADSEYVWVREMARFRLGLGAHPKTTAALLKTDKRVEHVQKLYAALDDNPFLVPFFDRYHAVLHLNPRIVSEPLGSPLGAPTKSGTGTEVQKYRKARAVQRTVKSNRAKPRDPVENQNGKDRAPDVATDALYRKIAHEALAAVGAGGSIVDVTEEFKTLCARRRLAYDSTLAASVLASVLVSSR